MISFPSSTYYGKRIPKQKFYEKLSISPQLKRIFVDQIKQIIWQNKIAPSTIHVDAGDEVQEIEVFAIQLRQKNLNTSVLDQIEMVIPYHILFILEHDDEQQACIGFKADPAKPNIYFQSIWMKKGCNSVKLEGLNLDDVHENLVRQISGAQPAGEEKSDLKAQLTNDLNRQKMLAEIAALEKKISNEKQFNRLVELNQKLKQLKKALSS